MKNLYLVGGPMGVGKTTVCRELKNRLPNSVFLDGDWCWDSHPFRVTGETKAMVMDNICHLLGNFLRCSVYENVIFCWVMHRQEILDEILSRLDTTGCRVWPVSLLAGEEVLRARLEGDIRRGLRAPDAVENSLARLPLYQGLRTCKIATDGKTPREVAEELAGMAALLEGKRLARDPAVKKYDDVEEALRELKE